MDAVLDYNEQNKGKFQETISAISMASAMTGAYSDLAKQLNELSLNQLKVTAKTVAQAQSDADEMEKEKARAKDAQKSLTDTVVDVQKQAQTMKMVIQDELTKNLYDFSKVVKLNNLNIDPKMMVTMKTGLKIDNLISHEGGIPASTNIIMIGDPGVGKTTVLLDVLAAAQNKGSK